MESYEVLEKAIPKKMSEKVAQYLNISATYVRRWRREPDSEDSPNATGQRSILDRICDLIDVVFLVYPAGASLIVDHIKAHYRNLIETHCGTIDCHQDRAEHAANLLKEATEAINKLSLEGCSNDSLKELIELRDTATRTISAVRRTLDKSKNRGARLTR